MIARCKVCGKEFKHYPSQSAIYCSQSCYHSDRKPNLKDRFTCLVCGKQFEAYPSEQKRYCSPGCYHDSTKGRAAANKGERASKVCEQCGKKFEVPIYLDRIRFCSIRCAGDHKKLRRGENHPLYKKPAVLICKQCGKRFEAKPVFADPIKGKQFCSRKCLGSWVMAHQETISKLEKEFGALMAANGIKASPQYRLGKYCCDFSIPDRRLLIEVHGDFWHSLPKAKERDQQKSEYVKKKGWNQIVFWEREIRTHPERCIRKIKQAIEAFRSRQTHNSLDFFLPPSSHNKPNRKAR